MFLILILKVDKRPSGRLTIKETYLGVLVKLIVLIIFFIQPLIASSNDPIFERRQEILDKMVQEIKRLDAEELSFRNKTRPETFEQTVAELRQEINKAKNRGEIGIVFRKLDATYPNLHAQVYLHDSLLFSPARVRLPVRISATSIKKGQKVFQFQIGGIKVDELKDLRRIKMPATGDIVLAIQGEDIQDIFKRYRVFCKFPLLEQCANSFEKFGLTRGLVIPIQETITLKLKRNNLVFETTLPWNKSVEAPPERAPSNQQTICEEQKELYPGWQTRYEGLNICLLENPSRPAVYLLRIQSFAYRDQDEKEQIQSLEDEVQNFVINFWQKEAPNIKKLIIDVQYNGGGDVPVPWYKLFFPFNFQEQYYQQKNIAELKDPSIRINLFYEDAGKEIWYQNLLANIKYSKFKEGDYLPILPQFCVDETKDCTVGQFQGKDYKFKGKIAILVDQECISSCAGFVWQLKDKLKKRVKIIGMPDSGDTNYARLFIDVYEKETSPFFEFKILGRKGRSKNQPDKESSPLIRQIVSVTRSTDSKGKILSNTPTPVDVWVPPSYYNFDKSYEDLLMIEALKD